MTIRHNNQISKILLDGLYDQHCPISRLRGCPHLLRIIWEDVKDYWTRMIELPFEKEEEGDGCYGVIEVDNTSSTSSFFLTPIKWCAWDDDEIYSFPSPSDININMMPFIVDETFESCKLPEFVRPYWSLIQACIAPELSRSSDNLWPKRTNPSDLGKVYYLTIQESQVEAGCSQRRKGLHVDSPGEVKIKNDVHEEFLVGKGSSQPFRGHHWGRGCAHYIGNCLAEDIVKNTDDNSEENTSEYDNPFVIQGGIYIGSSVSSSCKAWNCKVSPEVVGRLGNIEHIRCALPGPGLELKAGQLYWITDRTPHESLALPKGTYRQFFRLVTSQVSLWYKDHSTPNPNGVEPDQAITSIVVGDKFGEDGVEIVDFPITLKRESVDLQQNK